MHRISIVVCGSRLIAVRRCSRGETNAAVSAPPVVGFGVEMEEAATTKGWAREPVLSKGKREVAWRTHLYEEQSMWQRHGAIALRSQAEKTD